MKIKVRRGILFSLVALLFLSTFAIWWAGDWAGRASAETLTKQLMNRVRDGVTQRVGRDLSPVMAMAKLDANLLSEGVLELDLADPVARRRIFETFESQARQFRPDQFYVGDEAGNFVLLAQRKDGTVIQRVIVPSANARYEDHFRPDGTTERKPFTTAYNHRERPWYQGAQRSGEFWTDVYTFSATGELGITASAAISAADATGQEFRGAVGMDITLASLSEFLARTEISDRGQAFLLDENGKLVAHPNAKLVHTRADGQLELIRAGESADPVVAKSYERFAQRLKSAEPLSVGAPFRDRVAIADEQWRVMISPLELGEKFPRFYVAIALPEDDFLTDIKNNRLISGIIAVCAIGLGVLIAIVVTRGIARPILRLEDAMNRVQKMDLDIQTDIPTNYIEIDHMVRSFGRMVHGLRNFSRFVPRDVVLDLLAAGQSAEVGGQERELSMFFSDIEGFTSIAEAMPTRDLFAQLQEYFEEVVDVLKDHHATLDKFIGDAVMAFWNAPKDDANHRLNCALGAIAVQRRLSEMNAKWTAAGRPAFLTRVGISTGPVMVGNVGSSSRLNYTALGDHVNLAARLEGANKYYGSWIIASEFLLAGLPENRIVTQPLDVIAVTGRVGGVKIFEVLGTHGTVSAQRLEAAAVYADGFAMYLDRRFTDALGKFRKVKDILGDYVAADVMIARCQTFEKNPPDPTWAGISTTPGK